MQNLTSKIFIAGHNGMVGSSIHRTLQSQNYKNIITADRSELDLTVQEKVYNYLSIHKPDYIFMAAAKVGGILANSTYPADFIYNNMVIQINIIEGAYRAGIKNLMFLGSSCIYPKESPQPILEEYLLSGPLESTNRPYAIAKISGIESCWSYNRQFGTQYLSVMPTNLYGINDNYHPENSHVIPGLIRRFHDSLTTKLSSVNIWGSGRARRDFLDVDDLSQACIDLAKLHSSNRLDQLFDSSIPPLVNIGSGSDVSIRDLSFMIREHMGYSGDLRFDDSLPDGTILKKLDISRLKQLIDFQPTPISAGLPKAINDFRNNLERYL